MPVKEREAPTCLIAVPTLRRPHFLPRILACFERLDYEKKKMVIINDDPETKLIYNKDPRVEIINIDKQLPLAVKRNMFHNWNYDIVFPLDDDDLFTPCRIKNHVKAYTDSFFSIDLYRNTACYLIYENKLSIKPYSSFTNSSFTRSGFFKSTGYTNFDKSNQDDLSIHRNFTQNCVTHVIQDTSRIDFIYDFNRSRYHNTYNSHEIMGQSHICRTIKENTRKGDIVLEPDFTAYDIAIKLCSSLKESDVIQLDFLNNGATFIKA